MKVVTIGGGPAGLYFAVLMKKADPSHDVTVFERNGPDDAFGWGVVFSDQTLGNFRAADPTSFDDIARRFAKWDDIDVHVKGATITSGGHGFCGLSRKTLLNILQWRAADLGVDLRFHQEIQDDGEGYIPGREGVGLANVRSRLGLLYKGRHQIEILGASGRGTLVVLRLPLDITGGVES